MSPKSPAALKASYNPCPKSTSYEFGGPLGAVGVTLAVPFFSYWLAFACTSDACPPWPLSTFLSFHSTGWTGMLGGKTWWNSLWSVEGLAAYGAWYAFTVVCWFVLPGEMVQGGEMRNGERLEYKMNGALGSGSRVDRELTIGGSVRDAGGVVGGRGGYDGDGGIGTVAVDLGALGRAHLGEFVDERRAGEWASA